MVTFRGLFLNLYSIMLLFTSCPDDGGCLQSVPFSFPLVSFFSRSSFEYCFKRMCSWAVSLEEWWVVTVVRFVATIWRLDIGDHRPSLFSFFFPRLSGTPPLTLFWRGDCVSGPSRPFDLIGTKDNPFFPLFPFRALRLVQVFCSCHAVRPCPGLSLLCLKEKAIRFVLFPPPQLASTRN